MIGPFILAGVEEGMLGFGFGVDACGEVVAATIATGTSKGEVLGFIIATEGLGEEMVEGEQGCAAGF
jgi:hypothetical protein